MVIAGMIKVRLVTHRHLPKQNQVIEGMNVVTKHQKKRRTRSYDRSLSLVSQSCFKRRVDGNEKPVRVGYQSN